MTLTRLLAELVINTPDHALGERADHAAHRLILDTIGAALAGWQAPGIPQVLKVTEGWGGTPEATVWSYGAELPCPNAAFVNACMVHALDYDDVHFSSVLHLMSSMLPATLAAAEYAGSSGRGLLSAVALGIEAAVRIGNIAKEAGMDFGYLPSSTVGIFGTTAACCRLLGLSVEQTVNAMGIAYAQSSGSRQALLDHTLTKRLQPAFAARSALWSAFLAADGITGPHRALEGEAGFFKVYVGCEPPSADRLSPANDFWEVERVAIKPYPSCGANHRTTQAAITLAHEEDLAPDDIAEIHLDLGYKDVWFVGAPWEIGSDPQVDAQFSVRYSAALGLMRRRAGLREYAAEQVLGDRAVSDMAKQVHIHEIPNTQHLRTDQVEVTVSVVTNDGRRLSRSAINLKGHWMNPLSDEEVNAKFNECVDFAGIWPDTQRRAVLTAVDGLETLDNVAGLVATLVAPAARAGLDASFSTDTRS